MQIPVTEAKTQLLDLIRRAESGEEIILTRHGTPVARITMLASIAERRRAALAAARAAARNATPGESAAHSQDFLYDDETGLPV